MSYFMTSSVFRPGLIDNTSPLCNLALMTDTGPTHITVTVMRQSMTPDVRRVWLLMLDAISVSKGTYFGPPRSGPKLDQGGQNGDQSDRHYGPTATDIDLATGAGLSIPPTASGKVSPK